MIDREKVIKGLECCINPVPHICRKCSYKGTPDDYPHCVHSRLQTDALELLKEQEPILLENQHKPYGISTNANSPWISRCPRCDKKIECKQTRFCKYCGQAVKWDE